MFSKKYGFSSTPPVSYRHEAPTNMRHAVIKAAYQELSYGQIREALCDILYLQPNPNNWIPIPNIRDEVEQIIQGTKWYKVYDCIEGLVSIIEGTYGYHAAEGFVERINQMFIETGGGWQYEGGERLVIRGDADFEAAVQSAQTALTETGFDIAAKEIREALSDLSRRPEPDLTGAVHHAMGAVEAAARYFTKTEKSLGDLTQALGLPSPLDVALKKMWGFSSNYGRHVSPTKQAAINEAQLIIHLGSAYCSFLAASR